jgi:signal transduction histidine kinase
LKQLVTELSALQPRVASAIALSRQNLDVEAQNKMRNLQPQFEEIERSSNHLLRLNQIRADEEIARINFLQWSAIILLAVLTVVWTVFALLTAMRVTRLIAERETWLRQTMRLLEDRNRELDAFAGRVAHDLRAPLNTINLAAAVIDEPKFDTSRASQALRRGVKAMETLIEDLLTLSRISGQTTGTTCHVASVAAFVRDDLRPKLEAVGGLLQIETDDAVVSCSEGLLRQVLWNLGENAVKYRRTDVQSQLKIHGHATPRSYEITVSDNGMGMSAMEVDHAFEPFFRGEQVRATPGTGLGLSIVKRVIEASGGSVSIDSVPGRGTTFRIQLPLGASKAA